MVVVSVIATYITSVFSFGHFSTGKTCITHFSVFFSWYEPDWYWVFLCGSLFWLSTNILRNLRIRTKLSTWRYVNWWAPSLFKACSGRLPFHWGTQYLHKEVLSLVNSDFLEITLLIFCLTDTLSATRCAKLKKKKMEPLFSTWKLPVNTNISWSLPQPCPSLVPDTSKSHSNWHSEDNLNLFSIYLL